MREASRNFIFILALFALITVIKHAASAHDDNKVQDGSLWFPSLFTPQTLGRGASILPSGCRYMVHLATSIRGSTYRDKEFCSLTLSGRCTSSSSTFRNPFSKNRLLCRDPLDALAITHIKRLSHAADDSLHC